LQTFIPDCLKTKFDKKKLVCY